ncbi:sulfatase-like hydrolase/transferase [Pseudazoarcus pumilus]|uniref:Sulfatase n=1 Tax=Pseudazoarcus pumilus TaxID=2067960 RepID=A0A2I6S384_9RHOO|nr:sulfatase-like hydrolase/transferase [Pseudazoarcus pumilus]AUN93705.1 sulfatase [Pseudazoarcus pumilus]
MKAQNLVVFISDEHNIRTVGCYGNPIVHTPNIDALAARGTRFASAYCTNPVCIPARAGFATGKYSHQIGFWDNADPYDGSIPSWHHLLRDRGHWVMSIGKLHFRSTDDDNGFSEERIPMHVIDGKGDLMGLVRDDLPERKGAWKMAGMAGPGESLYTRYDRDITEQAQIWLREEAARHRDKPWVLFVSLVSPHFPLTAPSEYFYRYYDDPRLPMPKLYAPGERPDHSYLREYGDCFAYDKYFDSDDKVRRAVAGYYGLCTFMDEQVGKVMRTLEETGLLDDTRVMYTSDHGDNLGSRGVWGKSTMYEEAAAVPLIIAGEGIPQGRVVDAAVSHVDVHPFILEATGEAGLIPGDQPGTSLMAIQTAPDPERTVLSEYHGMGSKAGMFMVRYRNYKYVHYISHPEQLFDLRADPEELVDLAGDPAHAEALAEGRRRLNEMLDPVEVDRRAHMRQRELLAANGGREAVIARGDLGFSVPPGVQPNFD